MSKTQDECSPGSHCYAAPGDLEVGEYVFACRWGDADWNDPWCIGYVGERGKNYIELTEHDGRPIAGVGSRGFLYFRRISGEQGAKIVKEYRQREGLLFDEAVRDRLFEA